MVPNINEWGSRDVHDVRGMDCTGSENGYSSIEKMKVQSLLTTEGWTSEGTVTSLEPCRL